MFVTEKRQNRFGQHSLWDLTDPMEGFWMLRLNIVKSANFFNCTKRRTEKATIKSWKKAMGAP